MTTSIIPINQTSQASHLSFSFAVNAFQLVSTPQHTQQGAERCSSALPQLPLVSQQSGAFQSMLLVEKVRSPKSTEQQLSARAAPKCWKAWSTSSISLLCPGWQLSVPVPPAHHLFSTCFTPATAKRAVQLWTATTSLQWHVSPQAEQEPAGVLPCFSLSRDYLRSWQAPGQYLILHANLVYATSSLRNRSVWKWWSVNW